MLLLLLSVASLIAAQGAGNVDDTAFIHSFIHLFDSGSMTNKTQVMFTNFFAVTVLNYFSLSMIYSK